MTRFTAINLEKTDCCFIFLLNSVVFAPKKAEIHRGFAMAWLRLMLLPVAQAHLAVYYGWHSYQGHWWVPWSHTWVYVPIYMSICGTRSGWRQCSYEVEGLPDACHIKQASGSSLPVPIIIGRWTDHINLQAEVAESGIKLFSHMAGYEYRNRYQRIISSV